MNYAIILSGGSGTRIKGSNIPKQYIEIGGKPLIKYCFDCFCSDSNIDGIVIVCCNEWKEFLTEKLSLTSNKKFLRFGEAGESRQGSVLNGLLVLQHYAKGNDVVIIQDAARPFTEKKLIDNCIKKAKICGGAMPALNVKDTIYTSPNGVLIEGLLNRDSLFAGQSPEAFNYAEYCSINFKASADEIANTRGSSEIAFRHGMKIEIIQGDENNFKVTTDADLEHCKEILDL